MYASGLASRMADSPAAAAVAADGPGTSDLDILDPPPDDLLFKVVAERLDLGPIDASVLIADEAAKAGGSALNPNPSATR